MSSTGLTAVFSSEQLGGSELFNLEFLRRARARGVHAHAIVPADGPLTGALAEVADSVTHIPIPAALTGMSRFEAGVGFRRLPTRIAALVAYLPALGAALARAGGPVCGFGLRSQLAISAALRPGRRSMWVVHEVVPDGVPARMWREAARRPQEIVAYSRAAASQPALSGRGAEVRAVRFDLSAYEAVPSIAGVRTVGLVGDLVELKNHLQAVDTVRRVRTLGAEISLVLVGRDVSASVPRTVAYAARVRESVAGLANAELISCEPAEMPRVMARFDVLLALSTVPESFGRVCVEAMSAGRPVIAYDHGGVSELIDSGRTGRLCPPGDAEAVTRALLELAADPPLAVRMGERARAEAVARFSQRPHLADTVGDAIADFAHGQR